MTLLIELVALCMVYWGACWMGTGGDEKNLRSLHTYPDAVQEVVRFRPEFSGKICAQRPALVFAGNLLLFVIVLFVPGLPVRQEAFAGNFVNVLVLGQGLNLFDLLVIDLLWWRRTRRVRFSGTEDLPLLYADPRKHVYAFLRGVILFLVVAMADGWLLTLV